MMPARRSGGGPTVILVLSSTMLWGCIDLANLRAVPDGGSSSGAGGVPSLVGSGGAPSLGSGGAPSLGSGGAPPVGSGGAPPLGSGGAPPLVGSGGAPPLGTGGEPVAGHIGMGGEIVGSGGAATPPPGTLSVEVRDLDADGTDEVIMVDNTTGVATVVEDEPGQPVAEPLPAGFAGRVVFGDFDGDGSTDLAFLALLPPLALGSGATVQVLVTLNNRLAGVFAPPDVYDLVGMQADVALPFLSLDVEGDGQLDLRVLGSGVTELLVNDGRGDFTIAAPTPVVGFLSPHGASTCLGCGVVNPAARAVP